MTFTSRATDPDGDIVHYGWDFDGDGTEDATGTEVTHTFTTPGDHDVTHRSSTTSTPSHPKPPP